MFFIFKKIYHIKKKPGDRVNFKILCHENLKINFARPNILYKNFLIHHRNYKF